MFCCQWNSKKYLLSDFHNFATLLLSVFDVHFDRLIFPIKWVPKHAWRVWLVYIRWTVESLNTWGVGRRYLLGPMSITTYWTVGRAGGLERPLSASYQYVKVPPLAILETTFPDGNTVDWEENYIFGHGHQLLDTRVLTRNKQVLITCYLKGHNTQHGGHMGQHFSKWINGWNLFQGSS